jgi:DNA invertase Pin-like site-specific DNA recombinase
MQEAGIRFVAADMPEANELTIHIMAAMAQYERKAISERTRVALAAAKARGTKLGGWRGGPVVDHRQGTAAKQEKAQAFNASVLQAIAEIQAGGASSLSQIALALNEQGVRTSRGGRWQPTQVARVLATAGQPGDAR